MMAFYGMSRLDCGVSGQRPAGLQKLHVLAGAAGLHKGHQHPLALPANQHPVGSPDIQGAERPYCHTQGECSSHWQPLAANSRPGGGIDLQVLITVEARWISKPLIKQAMTILKLLVKCEVFGHSEEEAVTSSGCIYILRVCVCIYIHVQIYI